MNVSGFNSAAINSAVPDVTVRAAVYGGAYAMGSIRGRARIRLFATQTATASAVVNPRRGVRHEGAFAAQALRTGGNSAGRRMLINGQAIAQTSHISHGVLLRLNVSAFATAIVQSRAARRELIAGNATAQTVFSGHKAARNLATQTASAQSAQAGRKLARVPHQTSVTAQSTVIARAARRSSMLEQAFAMGYVGANSTVQYPYDEPALEENTFIVPFENNLFYVR